MTTQYIELSPDGQAGQKLKVGNHIIDWVKSPNFISRYATCVCYQCKRHVTCETVNKSFWQNRAENWGVGSLFFCLLKGQRHLKTKHIQQVMEYAVTCFFIPISGTAAGKYRKPWEARKRALSQQILIWTS